jgi:hypothetical protein
MYSHFEKKNTSKKNQLLLQEGLGNKLYFVEQGIEEVITLKKGKGSNNGSLRW